VVNNHDIMDLPSHGRGRWFDSSIAHSQNISFCRLTMNQRCRRQTFPRILCSSAARLLRTLSTILYDPVHTCAHWAFLWRAGRLWMVVLRLVW